MLGYTFQIYFDFSGYSDMVIGLGEMLGLRFPANFDNPYRARNFVDFWRRWHISLSMWLRDYLYIPLGGNRLSRGRTTLNLQSVVKALPRRRWRATELSGGHCARAVRGW